MRRIKKGNVKMGAVILVFSLVLTAVLTGLLLWFQVLMDNKDLANGGVYPISKLEYAQLVENNGTLKIEAEKLVGGKVYQSNYTKNILKILTPLSAVFVIVLFSLSLGLWLVLKKMQAKETLKIVHALNAAMTEDISSSDSALKTTYESLKKMFDDRLLDYKRLNSYLSHEQKNALAILRTNLELTENTEYLKNLDYIADNIDDVLTLSENIEMSPLATVDVSLVCAEVCDSYRKVSNQIVFEFDESEDTEILARRRWIYRSIANLLDNAIKYGEGNQILVSVRAKNNSVIITVRDHGIGISQEKQEDIFNHHYRINELNKDGYGIGLSLVSHVCDLCGGFVTLNSKQGEGSTFYLSFPQKLF